MNYDKIIPCNRRLCRVWSAPDKGEGDGHEDVRQLALAAAFRVRIALNLKGIPCEETFIDLDAGDQYKPDFLAINPQAAVPAFFDGDGPPLTQSLAILDYLEDIHPEPALLPKEPRARARARSLAQVVACDTHPLYVPRVRNYLMSAYDIPKDDMMGFVRHWFETGLKTLETRPRPRARHRSLRARGHDQPRRSVLVSLWVGTGIFGVETAPYPTVKRIAEDCLSQEAFAKAHPLRQPGAPA